MSDHRREYAILFLIVAVGILVRARIAVMNPLLLEEFPLDEDAYYYFNIARNISNGGGIRHDSFNPTNGFQPLFCFMLVPIFAAIRNPLHAINAVMGFQIAIGVGGALAAYAMIRTASNTAIALFAALLWAVSGTFAFSDINGLETATAYLLLASISYGYLKWFVRPRESNPDSRQYVIFGALLGAGFLARVDLGLLALVAMADLLWRRRGRLLASGDLRRIAICGACAALIALPWLLYGIHLTGSPMPSSGQAVRFMSQAYGFRLLSDAAQYFPIGEIPGAYYLGTVRVGFEAVGSILSRIVPVWAGFPLIAAAAALSGKPFWRDLAAFRFLFAFLAMLFCAYVFFVFGQWYFERYFLPIALGYLVLVAISMKHLSGTRIGKGLSIALAVVSVAWIVPGTVRTARDITARTEPGERYKIARHINETTAEDAVIGAFQTGIVGYYLDRRFVSLDGKTNIEALRAMQDSRIDEYIDAQGIDYVMDWPWILRDLLVRRSADDDYLERQVLIAKRHYYIFELGAKHGHGRETPPIP